MKVSMHTQGGPELVKALTALGPAVSRKVQIEALTEAAEPMRAAAAAFAPRSERHAPHLADNIVIGIPTQAHLESGGHFDETAVEFGPSKRPHDVFYGYFQEYGTSRHRAQPFMRPAFDGGAASSLQMVMGRLWTAIAEAAKKQFSAQGRISGSSRGSTSGGGLL